MLRANTAGIEAANIAIWTMMLIIVEGRSIKRRLMLRKRLLLSLLVVKPCIVILLGCHAWNHLEAISSLDEGGTLLDNLCSSSMFEQTSRLVWYNSIIWALFIQQARILLLHIGVGDVMNLACVGMRVLVATSAGTSLNNTSIHIHMNPVLTAVRMIMAAAARRWRKLM